MPTLTLTRDATGAYPFLSQELQALMLFPDLPAERDACRATLILSNAAGQGDGIVSADAGLVRSALAGPGIDALRKRMQERAIKGYVAGEVLRGLRAQHAAGELPSVSACVRDLEQELAAYETFGGSKKGYGDRSIRAAWAEFKPVAHFWAAVRILMEGVQRRAVAAGSAEAVSAVLAHSLAADTLNRVPAAVVAGAVVLLRFASTIELSHAHGKEPLLASGEAWLLPADYPLPPELRKA